MPMTPAARAPGAWPGVASISLAVTLMAASGAAADRAAAGPLDADVKATFLYNFAKFTEWPSLQPGAPILVCVVGDDQIADALVAAVRGQNIGGHKLDVSRPHESTIWRLCHLLFIAAADVKRSAAGLGGIKTLPVLTVSDGKGFSQAGGVIEFYLEGGRVRFAINVDAADRARLRLRSQLLALAKVMRDVHVQ
jgi:hypothetical protein